jgi:hypothetical protein
MIPSPVTADVAATAGSLSADESTRLMATGKEASESEVVQQGPTVIPAARSGIGPSAMEETESSNESNDSASDPIMAAPHAIWYVRPASGGQYGPASGEVLRTWIDEGRVTGDSLLWREGWTDWRLAGSVVPGLGTELPAAQPLPIIVSESQRPDSFEPRFRSRKSSKSALTSVGILIIACVILFIILVYIIMNQG